MTITTSGTTLTFNDSTTQTTAPVNTSANVNSVSAGTGISVSATTGALTVTNSGVTSAVAGTGITVSGATGAVTISSTATGTVTSVATGNGLSGGTITTSGTLTIAAPGANTVGSYAMVGNNYPNNQSYSFGSNYSGGNPTNSTNIGACTSQYFPNATVISGTWKWLAGTTPNVSSCYSAVGIGVRVA
jgi:hypothetical protein